MTTHDSPHIVVIGGVAGGMSAAARARRLDEHAHITVLEAGHYVSFANCGLPYHVSGEIPEQDSLLMHTPDTLRAALNLDVRVDTTVTAIDPKQRLVSVTTAEGTDTVAYDALIIATGAEALAPPIPGLDLPHVTQLRTVDDALGLAERVQHSSHAVVLGAGFIGLEAAEALRHRGLDTTVVELAPQVLPPMAPEMSALVEQELRDHGVAVHTGTGATHIQEHHDGRVSVTLDNGTVLTADVVVASMGVRPRSGLARDAGLALDGRGAIVVDDRQRTSDPHIWAVGDVTSTTHAVTGVSGPTPLAGPANRQGRRAAEAIFGVATPASPVLGTAVVRVFGLTAALTGANARQLDAAGIDHTEIHLHAGHHAGYFPGASPVHMVVSFAPDGRLLGAQAVGTDGVDKRIDVLATALRAGFGADDLAELELAYAPPYGSAKDPVNMAGFMMQNVVAGTLSLWHPKDLEWARRESLILDVRSVREYASGHLPEAINIPHTEVRDQLDRIRALANGRPVRVHCASGFRSYLAHRILAQEGFDSANLSGGMMTLRTAVPDLELTTQESLAAAVAP
jgi:NADPH-dependent 2,4-dienoyl-CoA reductase/sulfur reductase-like enzyme/rhodanese-related sulfurtransferase